MPSLAEHASTMRNRHLRDLFAEDPARGDRMCLDVAGWYADFAKHRVTDETLSLLYELADVRDVRGYIDRMFRGDHINVSEDRPVLHVALRKPRDEALVVDGVDVVAQVHGVLDRMSAFAEQVRSGGRIRSVVNIGIGGSDLGPAMGYDALRAYSAPELRCYFVSNVDGADIAQVLQPLDPAKTLVIVSSKTFLTLETLTNAHAARTWLVDALGEAAVADHFVAVSTNRTAVVEFGCDPAFMFEFWDWVGGRYSIWSAIGLSLMIAIGPERFHELLAGAHEMDEHYRTAPWAENLPVRMALLSHWYRNLLDCQTHAVVPYAHVLARFPSYLEQLEMESLGKSVDITGAPVGVDTSAVVWGTPGTNGQHAYFQMLHQGTTIVPIDLIGFLRPQAAYSVPDHQRLLDANLFAQAEALAFGTDDPNLGPYRVMPGNRPSTVFLADHLDPHALGALIAAYEHKVATLGALWGIDAFDQWGVELGKELAGTIAEELATDAPLSHDTSTNALIRRYRSGAASSCA
jgi:glucose-6-phosphate isomerase